MKKSTLTFVILFSTLSAFSQQDSLLKTFKFRNSNYRAIGLNMGTGNEFNQQGFGGGTQQYIYSSNSISAGYYTAKSTDRILLTANTNLGASYYTNKTSSGNSDAKGKSFSISPQVVVLNKWFKNKRFIELGTSTNAYTTTDKSTSSNQSPIYNQQDNFSITLNAGIGIGRLENITDMQNALWLNKALQKNYSLTRSLSPTELNELGRTITAANNTRILDGRKRIQFILSTVDNFFQRKNLIAKNDINYFSNLNDILFFAFNTPRLSGTEKFIRLSPSLYGGGYNFGQNSNNDKSQQKLNNRSALLSIGINKFTPQNLIHQDNYGASINLYYVNLYRTNKDFTAGIVTNETLYDSTIKQAYLKLFYEYSIYPNTRTIVSFKIQSQGGYQEVNKRNSFFGSANLSSGIDYFISYRTRFNCNLGILYSNNVNETNSYLVYIQNRFQVYVNAGFTISI